MAAAKSAKASRLVRIPSIVSWGSIVANAKGIWPEIEIDSRVWETEYHTICNALVESMNGPVRW
jgi:hypothetical protein